MKRLFYSLAVLCSLGLTNAHAQLMPSGTLMLGGSMGVTSEKEGDADAFNTLTFAPTVGFFVIDGLAVGLTAFFQGNDDHRRAGGAPFVRGYLYKGIFLQGEYGFFKDRDEDFDITVKSSYLEFGLGYTHMLNESVGLEPKIFYNKELGDGEGSTFGLSIGIQAFLNRD